MAITLQTDLEINAFVILYACHISTFFKAIHPFEIAPFNKQIHFAMSNGYGTVK